MKHSSNTQSKALAHLNSARRYLGAHMLNKSTQRFGVGDLDDLMGLIDSAFEYERLSSDQKRQLDELVKWRRGETKRYEQALSQYEMEEPATEEKRRRIQKELDRFKKKASDRPSRVQEEYEIRKARILDDIRTKTSAELKEMNITTGTVISPIPQRYGPSKVEVHNLNKPSLHNVVWQGLEPDPTEHQHLLVRIVRGDGKVLVRGLTDHNKKFMLRFMSESQ